MNYKQRMIVDINQISSGKPRYFDGRGGEDRVEFYTADGKHHDKTVIYDSQLGKHVTLFKHWTLICHPG